MLGSALDVRDTPAGVAREVLAAVQLQLSRSMRPSARKRASPFQMNSSRNGWLLRSGTCRRLYGRSYDSVV